MKNSRLITAIIIFFILKGAVFGGGTYIKDGIKHFFITTYVDTIFFPDTWQYDPDAGDNSYSKVKIHLCTQEDIQNSGGIYDSSKELWCYDGDDDGNCDDDDDYIVSEDNPEAAVFYINFPITIDEGVKVEIADEVSVKVNIGPFEVNGSQQRPVIIDAGALFEFGAASNATLNYCQIKNGKGQYGGGLYLNQTSSFTLSNSEIKDNKADYGAGIFINGGSEIKIKNSIISGGNDASAGGGIYCINSSPEIRDCIIKENKDAFIGGGIFITGESSPVIINTTISNNTAQKGGGIYIQGATPSPVIVNSLICNNLGTSWGGGIYTEGNLAKIYSSVISNNAVYGSNGGGIYSSLSSLNVYNSIIYGNVSNWFENQNDSDYTYQQVYPETLTNGFALCNIQNGSCTSCIDTDPLFINPTQKKGTKSNGADADWSLQPDSPCINKGSSQSLLSPYDDADKTGNQRPYNKPSGVYSTYINVDIGAYEYQNNPPIIIDSNGVPIFKNITNNYSTDEDTAIPVTTLNGYSAVDVDSNDKLYQIISTFPDEGETDPALISSYGTINQYPNGSKLDSSNNEITDSMGRVEFAPANRKKDYKSYFTAKFFDGISPSFYGEKVDIDITADDDLPGFVSQPSVLKINSGDEYKYDIKVSDPDVDSEKTPSISAISLPSWLTFWDNDNATGGITGTPANDDVGNYDIVLSAVDESGNGATQEFSIEVEKSDLKVSIDKDTISGAPGDILVLKASSESASAQAVYDWVINDSNNNQVATFSGQGVTFDTTGLSEGEYKAVVTLKSGAISATDTATINLSKGFSNKDDSTKTKPDETSAASIDSLDKDSSVSEINKLSEFNLNVSQRDSVINAVSEKDLEKLSDSDINYVLGSLDNVVVANPTELDDYLTNDQLDKTISSLKKVSSDKEITKDQSQKVTEIIDEINTQNKDVSEAQTKTMLESLENLSASNSVDSDLAGNIADSTLLIINNKDDLTDTLADKTCDTYLNISSVSNLSDKSSKKITDSMGALIKIKSPITKDQTDKLISSLSNLVTNSTPGSDQIENISNTISSLMEKQGKENLSAEQQTKIESIMENLLKAAALSSDSVESQGSLFSISSLKINKNISSGPLTIGSDDEGKAKVTIYDIDGLKKMLGLDEFTIILSKNSLSTLSENTLYLLCVYNSLGEIIYTLSDISPMIEIGLPIEDENKKSPYYYDKNNLIWINDVIKDINESEKKVSFKTPYFGNYTMTSKGLAGDETSSSDKNDRSKSNCFISVLNF